MKLNNIRTKLSFILSSTPLFLRPFVLSLLITLAACTGIPDNIHPIESFDKNRYLGTWYEIARLDHSFERGLSNVTAEYSEHPDGGLKVINRGLSSVDKTWKYAEGKALFVGDPKVGHLKVSFFGPFYGSYIIFELDKEHYQYAFVTSHNRSYLWLLSRSPHISESLKSHFIETTRTLGFDDQALIFVKQESVQHR